jgi:hypothetical protein
MMHLDKTCLRQVLLNWILIAAVEINKQANERTGVELVGTNCFVLVFLNRYIAPGLAPYLPFVKNFYNSVESGSRL